MHKIVKQITNKYGIDIITSPRFVNIMDDFGAFAPNGTEVYKRIIRNIVNDGITNKLLIIGKWNDETKALAVDYSRLSGFQKDKIIYLFKCLAYGLNWVSEIPLPPCEQNISVVITPVRTNPAQHNKEQQNQSRNQTIVPPAINQQLKDAEKRAEEMRLKLLEAENRVQEAQRQMKEAQRRENIAQKKASDSQDKADKANARCKALEQKKMREVQEEYEMRESERIYKRTEKLKKIALGIAAVIWLCFAIISIFTISDGFWQTLVAVVVSGGSALLFMYGYAILDAIIDGIFDESHLAIHILCVLFFLVLVCVILGLGLKIVLWAD